MRIEYVCGDDVLLVCASTSPPRVGEEVAIRVEQTVHLFVVESQRRCVEASATPGDRTRWQPTERPESVQVFLDPWR